MAKQDLFLDGYIRVSRVSGRDKNGGSFISPEVQTAEIENWAHRRGAKILAWHTDLDQSGGKMTRPNFDKALARIDSGKTGGLIVAKLDRFARTISGALKAIERIEASGGTFVSVQEGVEPDSNHGKLVRNILFSLADFELERYRENWAKARAYAIERGIHIAGGVPFGYDKGEDKRLTPNSDAHVVERVFKMRAANTAWQEIADYITENSNGKRWTRRTAAHLIANRVYLGIAFSGGEFENKDAHPAIVTRELWQAAQRKTIIQNSKSKGDIGDFPLTGIVRCGSCGYRMTSDRYKHGDKRIEYYRCRGDHSFGKCPAPASITAKNLNDYVLGLFFERTKGIAAEAFQSNADYDSAVTELERAKDSLAAYLSDDEVKSLVPRETYLAAVKSRQEAVDAASEVLKSIEQGATGITLPEDAGAWSQFSIDEKRKILGSGLDAVLVKRTGKKNNPHIPVAERASILWRGEAPDDLPGLVRASALD